MQNVNNKNDGQMNTSDMNESYVDKESKDGKDGKDGKEGKEGKEDTEVKRGGVGVDNGRDRKELEKELSETKERMLRIAAEFENYKRRSESDMSRARRIGMVEAVKSMLPAIDEMELAINANAHERSDQLLKGVEMVYANMVESLKRMGVEQVDTKRRFDPNLHEIIMMKDDENEYGSIIEVVKKGYMFKDILIRPASVIISAGNKEQREKNDEIK